MNRRSPGLGLGARRFRAERLLTRTRWSPAESLCHLGIRSLPLCESGCDTCVAVQPFSLLPPVQYPSLQEPGLAPVGTGRRSARYGEKRSMEASSPRVVFVSNGPPVPVRGLSRCREPSPVLRGHVDVVRALAPALRTDRLNTVHVLYSRCDVRETWPPCSVCSPRTPAARPHLERGVAGVSGIAGYRTVVRGRPSQHDVPVRVHHRRQVGRSACLARSYLPASSCCPLLARPIDGELQLA